MRPGDHFLVVYDDLIERDSLAILFVECALKRKDFVVVFLQQKERIIRLLNSSKNLRAMKKALTKGTFLFVDNAQAFGRPPSLSSFERFYRDILERSKKMGLHVSLVGQFPVEFYDMYGDRKAIEQFIDSDTTTRRARVFVHG